MTRLLRSLHKTGRDAPRTASIALALALLAVATGPGAGVAQEPAEAPPTPEQVEAPPSPAEVEVPPSPAEVDEQVREELEQVEEELQEQIQLLEERLEEAQSRVDEARTEAERESGRVRRDAERRARRRSSDNQVSVGNTIWVREDEVAGDLVAVAAGIEVDGEVLGDVQAFLGSIVIDGRVTGSVRAVVGDVELGPNADVLGDVTSVGGRVDRDDDAQVLGRVSEVALGEDIGLDDAFRDINILPRTRWFRVGQLFEWMWGLFGLALMFLVGSICLLVLRPQVEHTSTYLESEPWRSGLIGLAVQVLFIPALVVLCVVLAITIIGIPLLFLVPFLVIAFLMLSFFGYVAGVLSVGRFVVRRFRIQSVSIFLALGLGILAVHALSMIGDFLAVFGPLWVPGVLVGIFGGLVVFLTWTVGLGAAFQLLFTTYRPRGSASASAARAPSPPPPPPPTGSTTDVAAEPEVGLDDTTEGGRPIGAEGESEPVESPEADDPVPDDGAAGGPIEESADAAPEDVDETADRDDRARDDDERR